MKNYLFSLFVLSLFKINFVIAQNLVPNGSFESFTLCPITGDKIFDAVGWFQPCRWPGGFTLNQSSSSDYYSACGGTGSPCWVPKNYSGFQNAFSGVSYIGLVYLANITDYREYAEVKLSHILEAGRKYKLTYFVSLLDGSMYASNQFDAYFSNDSLIDVSLLNVINVVPQISNLNQTIISDTMNWVQVSGSFIANGGENFLTLGNFHPDNLTDTIGVNSSPPSSNTAYYYIDEVSLEMDTLTGIEEIPNVDFLVYPNPAKNRVKIISQQFIEEVNVMNVQGKTIQKMQPIKTNNIIDVSLMDSGIYIVQCRFKNGAMSYKKIVLQKE